MIVFIGPVFTDDILVKHKATSPAASNWNIRFLNALVKYDVVSSISFINNSLFPKGKFYIKGQKSDGEFQNTLVSYFSLPIIREEIIYFKYCQELRRLIDDNINVQYLITYNTTKVNIRIGQYAKELGIKWICIYADADMDQQLLSNADYHIYFSFSAFIRSKYKLKYNFEGGSYMSRVPKFKNEFCKIFIYTGIIRIENGVDLLLDAFMRIKDPDARLHICGKGIYKGFYDKVGSDTRIIYFGTVNDDRLEEIYSNGDIFVNPRLSSFQENNNNFPSKLLHYLSYGKPIISTITDGINPRYLKVLHAFSDDTSENLYRKMCSLLKITEEERLYEYNKILKFSSEENSWDNRVTKLWSWIKDN